MFWHVTMICHDILNEKGFDICDSLLIRRTNLFYYLYTAIIFCSTLKRLPSLTFLPVPIGSHNFNSSLTYRYILKCGRKVEYPKKTNANMERTYKLLAYVALGQIHTKESSTA